MSGVRVQPLSHFSHVKIASTCLVFFPPITFFGSPFPSVLPFSPYACNRIVFEATYGSLLREASTAIVAGFGESPRTW